MAALPRTEQAVARSLAQTADPRDALARALRAIGESLGWRLGAVWEPSPDRPEALSLRRDLERRGRRAEDFEAASREHHAGRRRRAPGTRVAQRRAGLDPGRRGRRQLPARDGGAAGGPACGVLLPDPQRARRARRDRVLHRRAARARRRAARDHVGARRSDRPGGRAPPRRRGAAREGGAPSRDARRRARLRDHDGSRGPRRRFQPSRRAHVRLPGKRRGRARHGGADRPARAARASPPRARALPRDRGRRCSWIAASRSPASVSTGPPSRSS